MKLQHSHNQLKFRWSLSFGTVQLTNIIPTERVTAATMSFGSVSKTGAPVVVVYAVVVLAADVELDPPCECSND